MSVAEVIALLRQCPPEAPLCFETGDIRFVPETALPKPMIVHQGVAYLALKFVPAGQEVPR